MKKSLKKGSVAALTAAMLLNTGMFQVHRVSAAGFTGSLSNVVSATIDSDDAYIVHVNFNNEVNGKITFLENGIFRYNIDPTDSFEQYAKPNKKDHVAKMQAQPDDSDYYTHPGATVKEVNGTFEISSNGVTIILDKATAKMSVKNSKNEIVMQERAPLSIQSNATVQSLQDDENEYFFGGGMQNGRFSHKGKSILIENKGTWTDGGVASPNPFYWSTKGYGVFRNTFEPGVYDFGAAQEGTVTTKHNETEFDAYYFVENGDVTNKAEAILNDYYKITGNPAMLPEYAYYLAHLNCYNRDGWKASANETGWKLEDGKWYTELGKAHDYKIPNGTMMESLNNEMPTYLTDNFGGVINEDTYKYSARAVIDGYVANDTPLGWFLPNDGYGCGYGQNGYYTKRNASDPAADLTAMNAAVDANVANLKNFTDYANEQGVKVGLWTQSALDPLTSEKDKTYYHGYQNLRDFNKEVNNGGVMALKTDVAWVGDGYSFGLNATKTGYDTVAESGVRPTVVTLDGWAGTQRYGSIWSGDQTGGQWEYIRFHIPTYIGQSLSGNPNVGSDMNGIFGSDAIIQTRDFQWKTFTQVMLDMDGWGSEGKKPYYHGDPYQSINRMYLKLKAELMPYIYNEGMEATTGLPAIRAMFLEYPEDPNTYGDMVKYQYMYGSDFLVAPVYEDVNMSEDGHDVRNNIYLPGNDQIWIDYFTGKQYQGGKVLNGFDSPLWKLPLFVKNGAIVPMYEENNNPEAITETNPKGLNKANRVVEFWPNGNTEYEFNEDDGLSLDFKNNGDDDRNGIDYGDKVNTIINSDVKDDTATLTIHPSTGNYKGYDQNRKSTFVVNVQEKPESITAFNGSESLNIEEVTSLDSFNELSADDSKTVYFYDESPNLNKYAKDGETFDDVAITTTPKLYVKFARTDVQNNEQKLVVKGFNNTIEQDKNTENAALTVPANLKSVEEVKTPTSITVAWDAVADATSYEILTDGHIYSSGLDANGDPYQLLKVSDLKYSTSHQYQVRARNAQGYSAWSDALEVETLQDPFRNIPANMTMELNAKTGYDIDLVTDRDTISTWFSNYTEAEEIAKTKTFTFDFKENYQMDRVEIYSDPDVGGGYYRSKPGKVTVKRSMDNVHWETLYDNYPIEWDKNLGVIDLEGNNMRYLSITANTPVNSYIALAEIMPLKVDGTISTPIGSNNGQPVIDEASMTQIRAYAGAYEGSPTWGQVKDADINFNGVYDVYDMSYVLFQMDGGTKQTGSVSGNLYLDSNKKMVKAGEMFDVDLHAQNVKNANALGGVFTYDMNKYEVVSINKTDIVADMEDFSSNQDMGNGKGLLNIAYMNRGDKSLMNGSHIVSTITMRAKVDGAAYSSNDGLLIGPDYSFVNGTGPVEDSAFLKGILGKAMAKVDAISEDDMALLAPKVQAMIKDAYAAADAVMKNDAATKDQCLEAWTKLANALHYADFKADKTELKELIDICNGLNKDDYSAGFEAMLKALETAQGVYDDENALQARIDKAYSDLLNAKNALVMNGDTSKKDLADLVVMFDEIDATKYCDNAAWTAFVKAMDDAKAVLANNDAAPSQISTAMLALTSAYEDIRLLPSEDALNDLKAFITKVEALNLSAYGAENTARFMTVLGNARTMVNDPNTYDPAIFSEIKAINDIIDNGETVAPDAPTTGVDDPAAPEENVTPAPEKPAAPDTSVNGTTKPGTTKTGDTTNAMGLGAMFLASAGAFLGLKKRKKNRK